MHDGIAWVSFIMASLSVVRSIMRQISNLRPLVIYCLNFKRNYLKNEKSYDNAVFCIRKSVKRRTKRFSTLKMPLEHYFGRKMGLKLSYYTIKEVAVFPIKSNSNTVFFISLVSIYYVQGCRYLETLDIWKL